MNTQELVFCPLGGVGEIGMNCGLYGLVSPEQSEWIMVDCGMTFGDERAPGIDLILPDISFAVQEVSNLKGIVITHGHEDHVGAILHLWSQLRCPVYAPAFVAGLIAAKQASDPHFPKIPVTVIDARKTIEIGTFKVEAVAMSHSVPDTFGLYIQTPQGSVFHSADWKWDETPVIGPATDFERLQQIGDAGLLACVCDSTNAARQGHTPSEATVFEGLKAAISEAKGRVAVTLFSSNIARMKTIAEAAGACGREVVVLGRTIDRNVKIARELGLLDGVREFLSVEEFNKRPKNTVVGLMTGSQGERRAMLSRAAFDTHPLVSLDAGDTIIFSSRTIPGNERGVIDIINALSWRGVHIVTEDTHHVHVSGHPRQDELKKLYQVLKPQILIPVHGEPFHLKAHANFASACGVPFVVTIENGDMFQISGQHGVVNQVRVGRTYLDGQIMIDSEDPCIKARRNLSFVGLVNVVVVLKVEKKSIEIADLVINTHGVPEYDKDGRDILDFLEDCVEDSVSQVFRGRRSDLKSVENTIEKAVKGTLKRIWGKKPVCDVTVVEL